MSVCVVGRDSIAATFAAAIASKVAPVVLCGCPQEAMAAIAAQRCPYPDEPELGPLMADVLADGRLRAGTSLDAAVAGSRLTIVVASMALDESGKPDYRWLDQTTAQIAGGLKRGAAVLYDGVLGIGDTRQRFGPMLERGSGLRMGEDFGLAFSPGKSRPGHVLFDLRLRPKLVAAVNDKVRAEAMAFLQIWVETAVMGVDSLETAESVPLMEAAARRVNEALALELAELARSHGIDMHAAQAALDTQTAFPVSSPALMANGSDGIVATRLLEAASPGTGEAFATSLLGVSQRICDGAIAQALNRLEALGGALAGREVLVLPGDAHPDDHDPWQPPAQLVAELQRRGAVPRVAARLPDRGREVFEVVIAVDPRLHFAALELETFPRCRVLLDGASALSPRRVEAAGIRHVAP